MRIVLDEVDDSIYGDIIITPKEMSQLKYGEMVDGCTIFQKRRCYLGVRLQGLWENEEEDNWTEEDQESDA